MYLDREQDKIMYDTERASGDRQEVFDWLNKGPVKKPTRLQKLAITTAWYFSQGWIGTWWWLFSLIFWSVSLAMRETTILTYGVLLLVYFSTKGFTFLVTRTLPPVERGKTIDYWYLRYCANTPLSHEDVFLAKRHL